MGNKEKGNVPCVTLTLDIVSLADGGERILPSVEQLQANKAEMLMRLSIAEEDFERAEKAEEEAEAAEEAAETDAERARASRKKTRAGQLIQLAQARIFNERMAVKRTQAAFADREDALPKAKQTVYQIAVSSYKAVIDYEEGARVEVRGMPQLDTNKMMKERFAEILLDYEEQNGDDLTRPHAIRIWNRWMNETYPDENNIPNSSLLA